MDSGDRTVEWQCQGHIFEYLQHRSVSIIWAMTKNQGLYLDSWMCWGLEIRPLWSVHGL